MMMLGKKLQSLITIFKAREKEYCLKIRYEEERVQVRLRWRERIKADGPRTIWIGKSRLKEEAERTRLNNN